MNKRTIGIDVIKCIAIFFVLSVHFLLNTEFYSTSLTGENMFLQLNMRWLFFTCVPLFLMATGYLQNCKQICKKHYIKLIQFIILYFVISIFSLIFKHYYLNVQISFGTILKSSLNFTANGYSWYFEMFIGLYILIPFLNKLFFNLKTKMNKILLIIMLIILCSISTLGYFVDYWQIIYPILYYYIGYYIYEYKPKLSKSIGFILIIFLVNLESIITGIVAIRLNNAIFSGLFDNYANIFTLSISFLIFLVFYDLKIKSKIIQEITIVISNLTLEIYLFSYIYDMYFYNEINQRYFITQQDFLRYIIILVPIIFFFSYISAYIIDFLKGNIYNVIKIKLQKLGRREDETNKDQGY